ncbi:MAG: TRZ/ATZ family protein [Clostridiales bacterium]|nr:TRZ/ATZ family protein [Clostridiales bacterium]
MKQINTHHIKEIAPELRAGESVLVSGTVYTARDAAHGRLSQMILQKQDLPFPLQGSVIYYAGPTPEKPGTVIGSCGPTTSSRMDPYTPALLDLGLGATIGKGPRSQEVVEAIVRNQSVYFCAIGGAGALAAKCITSLEVIAFPDLGCESIKKLTFKDFPLIVALDAQGNSIFVKN